LSFLIPDFVKSNTENERPGGENTIPVFDLMVGIEMFLTEDLSGPAEGPLIPAF
jgi:hypothetical protein